MPSDLTITELAAAYWRHCTSCYEQSRELNNIKDAPRPLRELYGKTAVGEFAPKRLKVTRQRMIEGGLARITVNQRVNRIRRMFRWDVEAELVEPSVLHALQAGDGLKPGRTDARETEPARSGKYDHIFRVCSRVTGEQDAPTTAPTLASPAMHRTNAHSATPIVAEGGQGQVAFT